MGKTLGTGGFAVVRECFCLKTGSKFAVKVMYIEKENRGEKTEEDGPVYGGRSRPIHRVQTHLTASRNTYAVDQFYDRTPRERL